MHLIFASLAKIPQKKYLVFLDLIIGDVDLGHVGKKINGGLLPSKITTFPFAVDKYLKKHSLKP